MLAIPDSFSSIVQINIIISLNLEHCKFNQMEVTFGESLANLVNRPWFTKLKPSKLVPTINNQLADLLICQTSFHQMLEKSQFAKLSPHQTFLLYSTLSAQRYRVDHSITDAISHFPVPTNRTDLWSFFGLANQISSRKKVVSHYSHHSVYYLALKMSSSGHQTINKFSMLLRMPSQPHQYCLTSMPVSLPTCLQMLASRALTSLYNKTLQVDGVLSKLGHGSSRLLNPNTQSLN